MEKDFQTLKARLNQWHEKAVGQWGIWIEDLADQQTWTVNEDQTFYAASVIKVPIMVAVYQQAWKGQFSLEEKIPLTKEMQVGGSGVLQHLSVGTLLSIQDLITLMIIQSDNTATNLLIQLVGKKTIQQVMKDLGMEQSAFYNPLMIVPVEREGVNLITAADVAACYRKIAKGEAVSYHHSLQMIHVLKNQQIQDCFPSQLPAPEEDLIGLPPLWELAHKTGMINRVLHDTGILYLRDRAFLLVALSADCSYEEARQQLGELARIVWEVYQ
ncbi:serine hydrolase [Hazenella coriacea]|uniref:Beta-lactamase class A n=1 Tax=Hazenella coriacea TaxID=1179467 RepID=A0A4R3L531_9BACL|nr:serine hydrolase [Hazenella coriacea]TCS93890.1 beta-lactamase class A [Hazenella coriacea]